MKENTLPASEATHAALTLIERYSAALAGGDSATMDALRAEDFELDFAPRDAFESNPLSSQETRAFWPAWFAAFPEMDYRVVRTIAAETMVVTEWVFLGVHSGPLEHPIFDGRIEPSGRTIRLRGISVYDVDSGLICCETTYVDLSTLYVELGVSP